MSNINPLHTPRITKKNAVRRRECHPLAPVCTCPQRNLRYCQTIRSHPGVMMSTKKNAAPRQTPTALDIATYKRHNLRDETLTIAPHPFPLLRPLSQTVKMSKSKRSEALAKWSGLICRADRTLPTQILRKIKIGHAPHAFKKDTIDRFIDSSIRSNARLPSVRQAGRHQAGIRQGKRGIEILKF